MSPASVAPDWMASKPSSRACCAMRGWGAKAGRRRSSCESSAPSNAQRLSRPSLDVNVSAWARAFAQHFAQARRAGRGHRAPIAFGIIDLRAAAAQDLAQFAAPAFAAENDDALSGDVVQIRQRKQSLAVKGRRGNRRVSDACCGERGGRAGTGCQCPQPRGPRIGRRHAVFRGVGGNEDRDVVLVQRRMRRVERSAIRWRQNRDRGKHDRPGAEHRQLLRDSRRLARRPRHDHAHTGQRTRRRGHALQRMHVQIGVRRVRQR